MSELSGLLSQLDRVMRQRRRVRGLEWQWRYWALLLGCLALIALVDIQWGVPLAFRLLLTFLGIPLAAVIARRWLSTRWTIAERPIQIARQATRRGRLVGDVIAAMQFQQGLHGSDELAEAGESIALKQAVIGDVARHLEEIDLRSQQLRLSPGGWISSLVVLATVTASVVGMDYAATFVTRMCGFPAYYPTRTQIRSVEFDRRGAKLVWHRVVDAWVVRGEIAPVRIECLGARPEKVVLELREPGTSSVVVPLGADSPAGDAQDGGRVVYEGKLPELQRGAEFRVLAGDAQTRWSPLAVRDRPVVAAKLIVHSPSYTHRPPLEVADLQVDVLPGSSVELHLEADQPLRLAEALVTQPEGDRTMSLEASGAERQNWIFPTTGSPLVAILDPQRLWLQVESDQGVQLARPLQLQIGLEPDQSPEVKAAVEGELVVPQAKPVIFYEARDDYGVKQVQLQVAIHRSDGQVVEHQLVLHPDGAEKLPAVTGNYVWDLSTLELRPGDRIVATPRVTDFREPLPSQTADGPSFELRVGDPADVLAEISKADADSLRMLDEIIGLLSETAAENPAAK
ncbi:MAG: DUF4175 family protein [Pirellulales bacterium]